MKAMILKIYSALLLTCVPMIEDGRFEVIVHVYDTPLFNKVSDNKVPDYLIQDKRNYYDMKSEK